MGKALTPASSRIVLRGITWPTFEALLKDLGDHRGGRIAYDQGDLEIMSPSDTHERVKRLIGRLVEAFTEELEIDILSCGSTTLKSVLKQKGVEPDECYYVEHESLVRGKEIDLSVDPPPDLGIEVDLTSSSLDRRGIYAALGVPEIWVHEDEEIRVLRLASGSYVPADRSGVLPLLPMSELGRFLAMRGTMSETALVRAFRAWVRERFGPGPGS